MELSNKYCDLSNQGTLLKVRNGLNHSISLLLAVLLIASMLVIPLCISPLYLRTVSAEEFSNSALANSTAIVTNSTLTNSTAIFTIHLVGNFPVPNANSTSANSINGTLSYQNNTNNKILNLNSTILLNSKSLKNSTAQGDVKVENNTNKNSLTLSGSGFVKETVSSTRNLSNLTMSVWVKPDYSQGSPQFTAISKENSFDLGVNNHIPPIEVVVFSVFDGIRWHSTNSTVQIPEEWTQIVGTFNGTHIGIYVNGHKESTLAISDITTISVNGKLETKNISTISSNADIVIGASLNSVRGNTYNLFSGSLEDAKIYASLLSDSQISELYHQNIHSNGKTTTTR